MLMSRQSQRRNLMSILSCVQNFGTKILVSKVSMSRFLCVEKIPSDFRAFKNDYSQTFVNWAAFWFFVLKGAYVQTFALQIVLCVFLLFVAFGKVTSLMKFTLKMFLRMRQYETWLKFFQKRNNCVQPKNEITSTIKASVVFYRFFLFLIILFYR